MAFEQARSAHIELQRPEWIERDEDLAGVGVNAVVAIAQTRVLKNAGLVEVDERAVVGRHQVLLISRKEISLGSVKSLLLTGRTLDGNASAAHRMA